MQLFYDSDFALEGYDPLEAYEIPYQLSSGIKLSNQPKDIDTNQYSVYDSKTGVALEQSSMVERLKRDIEKVFNQSNTSILPLSSVADVFSARLSRPISIVKGYHYQVVLGELELMPSSLPLPLQTLSELVSQFIENTNHPSKLIMSNLTEKHISGHLVIDDSLAHLNSNSQDTSYSKNVNRVAKLLWKHCLTKKVICALWH